MSNWVYMVRCCDGSLYTGWTTDLQRRITAHNRGDGAKYTRSRLPVQLVWAERCENKSMALCREAQVKKLSKSQKETLCLQWNQYKIEEN